MKAKILIDSGKAPGSDATLAKIHKAGGPQVAGETELFHIMWRNEAIPKKFKDASIIHLFKSSSLCASQWGISFLSNARKILTRVNEHLEQTAFLLESKCGVKKGIGTIDIIFTARQLQEKC